MRMRIHVAAFFVSFCLAVAIEYSHADLLNSIQSGNAKEVSEYVSQNQTLLNAKVLNGVTPLQSAIDGKQPEIAILLIQKGADIRARFADGNSPLQHAAYLDEDGVVKLLLSIGKPVDAPAQVDQALEMATLNGSLKVATLLIAHGANANPPHARPILTAISNNHPAIARLLLAHGANCGFRDVNGNTLLHYQPGNSGKDVSSEFIEMFLACGVNVNARNNLGETALFDVLRFGSAELPLAERLITKGADVNARNNGAQTPLLHTAHIGKLSSDILRFLLRYGADINARDHDGMGLLHSLAGSIGTVNTESFELAINLGADVNAKAGSPEHRSTEGYTPLHMAAQAGHTEIGALLINRGAKINELNAAHQTPLVLALEKGRADFARMVIKHGADVSIRNGSQLTPLGIAVSQSDVVTTRLLLEHGADVQATSGMDPPLIIAVKSGNIEITRTLLAKGAAVNAQGGGGMTALHWTARDGREELTRLLLEHGANVNSKDSNGTVPIQIAAQPIVSLLTAKGAISPPEADPEMSEQICKMVVTSANNGTLRNLHNAPPDYERGLTLGDDRSESDTELESVDEMYQIESKGSQYILGMAGEQPIYISLTGANHREEIVCRIGHEDNAYFVRSRAEVIARSHLLNKDDEHIFKIPAFPENLPRSLAEGAEIHVVAGYDVESRQSSRTGSNVVNINVNRPGKKVLLLLNSFNAVEWHVATSASTKISGILLTSYHSNYRSELDSTVGATAPVFRVQMPAALYELQTPKISQLLEQLHSWSDIRQVDSFFGNYYLPATVDITQPGTGDRRLSLDYPSVQSAPVEMKFDLYNRRLLPVRWSLSGLAASDGPSAAYLGTGHYAFAPGGKEAYILDHDQFIVLDMKTGATSHFALPSGFPPFSWATDLAYDTRRNIVSVASFGGEGFFYRFDVKVHRWLDYHSLKNIDTTSLAYDQVSDRYLAWTTEGELLFIGANGEIGDKQALADKLPGFYRLYEKDHLQEHLLELKPQGSHLALVGFKENKVSGIWYFNMDTKNALLTYKAK